MYPQINLFGKILPSYSTLAVIGGVFAYLLIKANKSKRKINSKALYIMIILLIAGMLIGGNLLYNIINFKTISYVLSNPQIVGGKLKAILILFNGSIFYGGLTGAILFSYIYLKIIKEPIKEYFDIISPAIPLFHAFGRVGCFLAGCCYGISCDVGFIFTSSTIDSANGIRRFPVQLLEAGLCLIIAAIVYLFFVKKILYGRLIWVYFLLYSIVRFFTEFLRGDNYRGVYGDFSLSQLISIIYFTLSIIYFSVYFIKKIKTQLKTKHNV